MERPCSVSPLEFDSPGDLNSARRAHTTIPSPEIWSGHVINKGEIRALVIDVVGVIKSELMHIECIEESEAKLEIHLFGELGVLGQREVKILNVGASEVRDPGSIAGISILAGTVDCGGVRILKVAERFERRNIEERA